MALRARLAVHLRSRPGQRRRHKPHLDEDHYRSAKKGELAAPLLLIACSCYSDMHCGRRA